MFATGSAFFQQAAAGYATLALTGTFAAGTVGVPYSSSLAITGGLAPYSLTGGTGVVSGSPPAGLSLSISGSTLVLSGTPSAAATAAFTASVGSADSQAATSAQSVAVVAANVYATLNPADKGAVSLSNGNLTANRTFNGTNETCRATQSIAVASYWESTGTVTSGSEACESGIATSSAALNTYLGASTSSVGGPYFTDGKCYFNGASVLSAGTTPSGSVVGHSFDPVTGTYAVTLDGTTWQTVKTGLTGTWFPAIDVADNNTTPVIKITVNFGASPFHWTVRSGYRAGVYT